MEEKHAQNAASAEAGAGVTVEVEDHSQRRKHIIATSIMVVLIVALIALLVWATASANADDDLSDVPEAYRDLESVVLIGADSAGKDSAGQLFGELIAKEVEDITGGKLTIDYHANGSLGGDADLMRQVQYNDIQLLVCQTAPTVSFIPEMAVFDLPMAFARNSGDEIEAVLNGEGEFREGVEAAYNKAGLHLLGFLQNATFRLTTSNVELRDLEDFKGLQIRTMENSNHMAFWQAISAEPTPLAWSELYISLQNGTVDAEENAADSILGASFQEVQRYLANTNHILYCNQVCINDEAWNALDPAYQEALNEAVQRAIDAMRPEMLSIDEESKAALQDGGMEIISYDDGFFGEVLALPDVERLYAAIDSATGGLGSVMTGQLANEGGARMEP